MNRPVEVPQGAYIQWEIELLDYEKQKVSKFMAMKRKTENEPSLSYTERKFPLGVHAPARYTYIYVFKNRLEEI